ncbi:hypothetical protein [Sinosporangium siamense]|uniref:Uncharacterized protein n=1 Tax=Sinosporangium siamense TaxID=1367973 RepID=A0A919RJW7_9ACTN|nr:hypothetical protein [Sinosporangium siamense]GII94988.1 hypothetical protein Ssi02_52190 [Sinosporangium siamense]
MRLARQSLPAERQLLDEVSPDDGPPEVLRKVFSGMAGALSDASRVVDAGYVRATEDIVTFTLTPAPDPFPYRFLHISDLHVSDPMLNRQVYPQPVEMGSADALTEFLAQLPDRVNNTL